MHHLDPGMGLNLEVFWFLQQSKWLWFITCVCYCMYLNLSVKTNKRKITHGTKIVKVFVLRVWWAKTQWPPNWAPWLTMPLHNTQAGIGGLGSLVYTWGSSRTSFGIEAPCPNTPNKQCKKKFQFSFSFRLCWKGRLCYISPTSQAILRSEGANLFVQALLEGFKWLCRCGFFRQIIPLRNCWLKKLLMFFCSAQDKLKISICLYHQAEQLIVLNRVQVTLRPISGFCALWDPWYPIFKAFFSV